MEIKAQLLKPYTENEKLNFIVEYNHNQGYVIEETAIGLQALGYTKEEIAQQEAERIAQLNMTRGDFIEGLILALGKDETDIIALIEALPITDVEKKVYINRVKNALDFYRGYPVIDVLCGYLGLTTEQMTQFFETKDWKCLCVKPDEELPTDEIVLPDEDIEDENTTDI